MKDNFKQCKLNCDEHYFFIKPSNQKCWLKQELTLNYCPQFNYSHKKLENIVPLFNNDLLPCLPGFVLEMDQALYKFNVKKYQEDHQKKILEYTMKKKDLLIPKPNKRYRYCGVCKSNYEEYIEHINSKSHQEKFSLNRYINKIQTIAKEYNQLQDDSVMQLSEQITLSQWKASISQTQQVVQNISKKRGRPRLTDEQKKERKEVRERNKKLGIVEQKKNKKIKTQPPQVDQEQIQQYQLNNYQEIFPLEYFLQLDPLRENKFPIIVLPDE